MLINFLFYFIAVLLFLSGFLVIFSKNPVQSVLFLVVVFCLTAQLIILLRVDFLALILIIVYVGAIAVLFLFVVMMLNIKIIELTETLYQYFPAGLILSITVLVQLLCSVYFLKSSHSDFSLDYKDWYELFYTNSNVVNLGEVLYTYYAFFLVFAGLILLLAMVGAIALTLDLDIDKKYVRVKSQSILFQVNRNIIDLNFWKRIS